MTFNFFLQSSVEADLSIMWITIAGFLVFFMHAGFTLVEAGFTQAKNAVNIAMKNLMAISVGTIVYWFIGYSLMYGESSNGFFRWSGFFAETAPHDLFFQTMNPAHMLLEIQLVSYFQNLFLNKLEYYYVSFKK